MAENKVNLSLHELDFDDESKVLAFVSDAQQLKQRVNRQRELESIQNIAWYVGHQELMISKGGLSRLPNPYNRVRLTYNQILPQVEIVVSRMGFEPIHYDVLPDGTATDEMRAASLRTAVLRGYAEEVLDFAELDETVNLWAAIAGEAFVKVTWDPYAGADIDALGELGMTEAQYRNTFKTDEVQLKTGDVCVRDVQTFNLFHGPDGARFEDAEWVLEANERTKGYLKERYDLDDDELAEIGSGDGEYLIHRLEDISPTGAIAERDSDSDTVVVWELWVRACGSLPKGRHVVIAGKKILRNQDNPYNHRRIPYVRIPYHIVPGWSHGLSLVSNLRGPQSDLNKNMSQQVENRQLMANPFILARRNSLVNESEWNDLVGGVRHFTGDQPPQIVPGVGMPNSTLQTLTQTKTFIQDLTAAHDVSQAKVPSGVKSGVAINTLKESDEARINRYARRRRKFWERVGELVLLTLEQFATEERYVQVLGKNRRWEVVAFTGEQLRGEGRPGLKQYRVRVRTNGLPKSRVAQTELVNSLLERGVFQLPPDQQRVVFQMLDLGDIGGGYDPKDADRQRARLENEMMLHGQYAQVRQFDDDETHQIEHKEFMRSEEFRQLDPRIQTLFEAHDLEHDKNKIRRNLKARMLVQQVAAEIGLLPGPGGAVGNESAPAKADNSREGSFEMAGAGVQ